jgi:hypothetical protein
LNVPLHARFVTSARLVGRHQARELADVVVAVETNAGVDDAVAAWNLSLGGSGGEEHRGGKTGKQRQQSLCVHKCRAI